MDPLDVKLDKNIPMPARYANNARSKWGEALSKMKVGDSFKTTGQSVSNMYIYAKVRGIKVREVRASKDRKDGTFRIWRIE